MKTSFDYTPLSQLVPASETWAEVRRLLRQQWFSVIFSLVVVSIILVAFLSTWQAQPVVVVGLVVIILSVKAYNLRNQANKKVRLRRFAIANQLQLVEGQEPSDKAGMIFDEGHSREIVEAFVLSQAWLKEAGNYRYVTGSGKHRQTHNFGYMVIPLPRRLPHMVLDARSNNFLGRLSNLTDSFSRSQVLSLEGDFNEHFTLYAPHEYETDALYIFTPDVMQAVIDEGRGFDMEVVDDKLYLYSSRAFNLLDGSELERLFTLAATIGQEVNEQADYYSDAKIGNRVANVIAEPGRRLEKGFPWAAVAMVVVFLLFQFLT